MKPALILKNEMFNIRIDTETDLRLLEECHAAEVHALLMQNLAHLGHELTWLDSQLTLEGAREYIRAGLARYEAEHWLRAGIWWRGGFAGVASLHELNLADRNASLGYWLGEAFVGHGLATRACKALIAHAFGELELNRLEIQCDTHNQRSRAVAQRLGFTPEGVLRQAWWDKDHFGDLAVYGLLAGEWIEAQTRGIGETAVT
jgi:ribosomal-protein-serine acetyltransferase